MVIGEPLAPLPPQASKNFKILLHASKNRPLVTGCTQLVNILLNKFPLMNVITTLQCKNFFYFIHIVFCLFMRIEYG